MLPSAACMRRHQELSHTVAEGQWGEGKERSREYIENVHTLSSPRSTPTGPGPVSPETLLSKDVHQSSPRAASTAKGRGEPQKTTTTPAPSTVLVSNRSFTTAACKRKFNAFNTPYHPHLSSLGAEIKRKKLKKLAPFESLIDTSTNGTPYRARTSNEPGR
jgi:hypothetical protein